LLRRIRKAVGSGVSPDIAADAVNDLYEAILEDRLKPEQIESEAPRFVRRVLRQFASRFGPLSLDVRDENGFGLSGGLLDDEAELEMERAAERAFG
jgi:hypothetical protein